MVKCTCKCITCIVLKCTCTCIMMKCTCRCITCIVLKCTCTCIMVKCTCIMCFLLLSLKKASADEVSLERLPFHVGLRCKNNH